MYSIDFTAIITGLGVSPAVGGIALIVVLIWSLCWKGWALWISARGEQKWWFIVLLILNTLGILEIIYIFIISKRIKKVEGEIK